ncbi:MAG: hotdog fold thioesterase [Erysipelotrichaceae bacterium]|nr:hotdog fold thioesterase [Erysipelotrichaceae bacterium]
MTENDLFKQITIFDNHKVITNVEGNFVMEIKVTENALNPYGTAHGGFLYTLCDTAAGATAATLGDYTVSLQGNINYIKPARKDDILTVNGKCIHNGNKTKVINVEVTNQKNQLICSSSFTMFFIAKIEE